ncbi:MAG: carbohydrate binding domain-containing protein [Saprospiraceae bacterium]|nr:carbohydrate binding domain-containing protein [Saprospiraceae bacterium]
MKKLFLFLAIMAGSYALYAQCEADRHTTNAHDGWISCQMSSNPNPAHGESHWIRYQFDRTYALYDLTLWNVNHPDFLNDGIRTAVIDVSTNGSNWTSVDTITIPKATGSGFYRGYHGPDLNGISARYVLITALENHGGGCYGLSEFRVYTEDQQTSDFSLDFTACENNGIYRGLNGGMGLGGAYSGAGVKDNGDDSFDFDAEAAGPGVHEISYAHAGGTETANITVFACGTAACGSCPVCNEYSQALVDSDMIPSDTYYGTELMSMGRVMTTGDVHFRGSTSVDLTDGFEVMDNSAFTANIKACDISSMVNGSFENGQEGWLFNQWDGASANLSIDDQESFDGQHSARVDVTNATGTGWNIQFRQIGHSIEAGKRYRVSFAAKAAGGGSFNYNVHLDQDPWTSYSSASPNIGAFWREHVIEFVAEDTVNGILRITFQFGDSPETTYWIDKVRFMELD